MKKRRHKSSPASTFKNQPFRGLKGIINDRPPKQETKPLPPPKPSPPPKLDDDALLEEAMADVEPITQMPKLAAKQSKPKPLLLEADEDELALKELDELVHGQREFSFSDTNEYIEASVVGLDRRIIRQLRRGEFSYQAHIDLHGLNRAEARATVGEFIRKCSLESMRCVLIIHGRGLSSRDNIPIIKNKLAAWLTRGSIGKRVLAYTSARPYDGGTGAVYVLLKT